MSRSLVTLRAAEPEDAVVLAELLSTSLRRVERADQIADVEQVIKAAAASPEQRMVLAEYDGEPAGAVLLRITTVSPLNLDLTVQALAPHVFPAFRRHGIGRLLMESAVSFAEEEGIALVSTAAASGSRDANRFMARLGLGPHATLRIAPTVAVRSRLTAQRATFSAAPTGNTRQLTRVLAARRSLRRSQTAG